MGTNNGEGEPLLPLEENRTQMFHLMELEVQVDWTLIDFEWLGCFFGNESPELLSLDKPE